MEIDATFNEDQLNELVKDFNFVSKLLVSDENLTMEPSGTV